MASVVAEIANAAHEQSSSLKEVSVAADQMDKVTQQNAAMVEEATAATQALSGDAEKLTQLVAHFQVGAVVAPTRTSRRAA